MSTKAVHKRKVILYSFVIFGLFIALAAFLLVTVQVPYTVTEIYEEEVPYEDIEYFNTTRDYVVLVPETEYETSEQEVRVVQTPSDQLAPEPTFRRERDCRFDDYNFSISYIGTPQTSYDFDWRSGIGYRKNKLVIGAEICNYEKYRLNAEFRVCNMFGDRVADCQDTLDARIVARSCDVQHLIWWTPFDPEKTIRLEPLLVSKKLVCRSQVKEFGEEEPGYTTVNLAPEKWLIDNLVRSGEIIYPGAEVFKTESGYLGIPKSRGELQGDVAVQTVTRTIPVTKYYPKNETEIIAEQQTVIKYSTVERTRDITKKRLLWEYLLIQLGLL